VPHSEIIALFGELRALRSPHGVGFLDGTLIACALGRGVKTSHGLDGVKMIEANFGAISSEMARHHANRVHERFQAQFNTMERGRAWSQMNFEISGREREGAREVEFSDGYGRGHRCGCDHDDKKFGDVVGSAIFAHRQRMEQRAEFRAEMHEIRSGIRDLMGNVEGGVLSPEQQHKFDGFVQEIVDLRESYDFRNWRTTDADLISARILNRFDIDPAPCGCAHTPNADAVAQLSEPAQIAVEQSGVADPSGETTSEQPTSTVEENDASIDESIEMTVTANPAESGSVDPLDASEPTPDEALIAMAEKLAGVIADASALMDDLLEALGA